MKEEKIKHLEFIQNIILRMNTNSFNIKGITITIVSALLAISFSEKNNQLLIITLFPIIVFWFLDSYYLSIERKFIGLYNDIVKDKKDNIELFKMDISIYKNGRFRFINVLFSKTILGFYFLSIIIVSSIYIFNKCQF
ncbi:hypothetical protein Q4553_13455 [Tenacibaculum soleae]|uniref:hypothetical protein n=1 Tax=Tenacibaculum soleae TaxID=447689 RepID=UPI0026E39A3E|nr:hypothetical protein [Tenacibaculum soleae]MDO6745570.1 hypothetical protein [Tenacibaculum soleae]